MSGANLYPYFYVNPVVPYPIFMYNNNAVSSLAHPISPTDTTILLAPNDGAKFPVLPNDGYITRFALVLNDLATNSVFEVCHVVDRTGDQLTVIRGQEGTTPKSWVTHDLCWNGPTAGQMAGLAQLTQLGSDPPIGGLNVLFQQVRSTETIRADLALYANAGTGFSNVQEFTVGYHQWPVPPNVSLFFVEMWGGGGGSGGGGTSSTAYLHSSSGGGGGGYINIIFGVGSGGPQNQQGYAWNIVVGGGGAAGTANGPGGTGGTSTIYSNYFVDCGLSLPQFWAYGGGGSQAVEGTVYGVSPGGGGTDEYPSGAILQVGGMPGRLQYWPATTLPSQTPNTCIIGVGGAAAMGGGGGPISNAGFPDGVVWNAGTPGGFPGGGASGVSVIRNANGTFTPQPGQRGGDGLVIVRW